MPPGHDRTANGDWSGSAGAMTVRYSLNEADGTIAGRVEFVVFNQVEGKRVGPGFAGWPTH